MYMIYLSVIAPFMHVQNANRKELVKGVVTTPYLTKMYNNAIINKEFPKEMLEAVIVTIPKPGKNPSSPTNYRPISKLNSDLKMNTLSDRSRPGWFR